MSAKSREQQRRVVAYVVTRLGVMQGELLGSKMPRNSEQLPLRHREELVESGIFSLRQLISGQSANGPKAGSRIVTMYRRVQRVKVFRLARISGSNGPA